MNLPPHILLVLDWAYAEYLEDGFSDRAARMVEEHKNVVMTRTFSKLHGMAGLRLGWGFSGRYPDHPCFYPWPFFC